MDKIKVHSQNMQKNTIKSILDMLVLQSIKTEPIYGNEIILKIKRKFDIFVSPSYLYSLLKSLSNNDFVRINTLRRKKIFQLTPKGEELRQQLLHDYFKMDELVRIWVNSTKPSFKKQYNLLPTSKATSFH